MICIDVPAAGEQLAAPQTRSVAARWRSTSPTRRRPSARRPHRERHGRVDAFVHNAGITRDKTLGRMEPEAWNQVLDVNLSSQERINDELLEASCSAAAGRLVSVSSVSGIAGNRGQTNYATSKAGVIGMVHALAPVLRERDATDERGRARLHRDGDDRGDAARHPRGRPADEQPVQGGQPVDVAETVAWLASPASAGVNGNVVRVCGQACSVPSTWRASVDATASLGHSRPGAHFAAGPGGGGDELPERVAVERCAEFDPEQIADYSRVCGFGVRDTLPATYPHVLAFPAADGADDRRGLSVLRARSGPHRQPDRAAAPIPAGA